MSLTGHYKVDQQSVVSETIDGEAVILDLRSGVYYSIAGIGADIWNALETGFTVEAIVERLITSFPAQADEVTHAAAAFVDDLIERKLLLAADAPAAPPAAELRFAGPFVTPALRSYEDMEDLLLLDPIHDVEEAGWPVRKPTDVAE